MNKNNYMYKLFKDMKEGYTEDDIDKIEQCARCWMQLNPENPFVYDTPEYEEFFQIQKSYTIWVRGDIDRKINRRRMISHAKALCALNPKQPYVFDKKADIEEKKAEEEKRKADLLKRQEKLIQTENKVEELSKIADNIETHQENKVVLNEPKKVLNVQEDEEKEKKSWLRFLHPWR